MTSPEKWFLRPHPDERAALRLFCLPFAGGGWQAYRHWQDSLPAGVELCAVRPPGRESRMGEPAFDRLEPLVGELRRLIEPLLDRPFALFGHSMGALISFELARRLRADGLPGPVHLIASGRRAPRIPRRKPPIGHLPDDELLEALRDYNGTPEAVLASEELMRVVLPGLRADFLVGETYAYRSEAPLQCPLDVFGGFGDPETNREELDAWGEETSGPFVVRMFPGDHFFLSGEERLLLPVLARVLHGHLR
jgi:medium-chain acyl-[acyl-carrier-protein] hydrolase